jgi:ATP-dependent protease ClpP protease subunit
MSTPVVIKFFASVNPATGNQLMTAIDSCVRDGVREILLLISTAGGSVLHGVSIYNYLRMTSASVTTCNIGSVESIGLALYCAGSRRISARHARFLLHGVTATFGGHVHLEEKQLEERLKSVRIDELTIARIVAANSQRSYRQVLRAMRNRTTLSPEQAVSWGLVHSIEELTLPEGASLVSIHDAAGAG